VNNVTLFRSYVTSAAASQHTFVLNWDTLVTNGDQMSLNYILQLSYKLILARMKSRIRVFGILIALVLFSVIFTKSAAAQQSYVSFQVFYDQLSPYGQWVDYPNYGYVWIPDAGPDFVPYSSGGHWIMTQYGWTWASDYSWGWAPFHYGRWDYDNNYGWFWIPGNEWGPAWVTWRRAQGYYGWEPMGPGISISMSFGNNYNNYNNHWVFVNEKYFGRNDFNRYYANQNDNERIFKSSSIINNTYVDSRRKTTYVTGPARADVQRVTGSNISSYSIKENSVPGQALSNGQFRTYRPQVMNNAENQKRPSPTTVTNIKDVKQPSERKTVIPQNTNTVKVQQQNTVNRKNTTDQQNKLNQQTTVNQQKTIKQQNAAKQQEIVKQQNATKQQEIVKQQNATKQQEIVKQQNATNQQNAVNQQNAIKQQNGANQKNAVNQNQVQKGQGTQSTKKGFVSKIFGKKTQTNDKTGTQQDNKK
jgi:hypothetical protein